MGYTWVNKGSASGLSFTYGNDIYTYDALNNELNKIQGSTTDTRITDLMFVFKNIPTSAINGNTLKVFVNHYKLK